MNLSLQTASSDGVIANHVDLICATSKIVHKPFISNIKCWQAYALLEIRSHKPGFLASLHYRLPVSEHQTSATGATKSISKVRNLDVPHHSLGILPGQVSGHSDEPPTGRSRCFVHTLRQRRHQSLLVPMTVIRVWYSFNEAANESTLVSSEIGILVLFPHRMVVSYETLMPGFTAVLRM